MSKYVSYDEMMEILDNKYLLPFRKDERLRGLSGIDVVRCKDCKHWDYEVSGCKCNPRDVTWRAWRDDDFCSYGERSEE